jgi:prepilin-type N-terminal cleavage/methylation domain-containing protein
VSRTSRRCRGEGGYTLSEVLVAVIILGVGVVAIVGALGSSIFTSRVHRDIVTSDATVRQYAEQLTRVVYAPCATPATYPAMTGVPAGYTVTIVDVDYADGSDGAPAFSDSCAANPANEVQRITLEAHHTGSEKAGIQRLQFVKRSS